MAGFLPRKYRSILWQALALGATALLIGWLASNAATNLEESGIAAGFGFLGQEAGFSIGETPIAYDDQADSYLRALLVGLANTLRVALIGIVLASVLGVIIGVARLSSNWLVARLSLTYVELARNTPLYLQLVFWYALITQLLPRPREAEPLPGGIFLTNRGLRLPVPAADPVHGWIGLALLVGAGAALALHLWARRTKRSLPLIPIGAGLVIVPPLAVWLMAGAPLSWSRPELQGFSFVGGLHVSPEFFALLLGLVLYTAAFIAEIVRSGILAVPKGQWEAGRALGLSDGTIMQRLVLPQALRVIIPPTTNQYLNLTKNSSLAVAVGYPDLVSVAGTSLNRTGQAIEVISLVMLVYLILSIGIAALMNWYNAHVALRER